MADLRKIKERKQGHVHNPVFEYLLHFTEHLCKDRKHANRALRLNPVDTAICRIYS